MNDVRGNAAERFWMFCRGGLSEMEKEMLEGGALPVRILRMLEFRFLDGLLPCRCTRYPAVRV